MNSAHISKETEYKTQLAITEAADEAFQAAVVKQFGRKRAGDMRYRSTLYNAATKAAAERYWIEANLLCDVVQALRTA